MDAKTAIKLIDERMCFGRGKWTKNHTPVIDEYWQAGTMAIEALTLPSADAVPVVRCKDCKYNRNPPSAGNALCDQFYGMTDQNGFCHFGERRTDGTAD